MERCCCLFIFSYLPTGNAASPACILFHARKGQPNWRACITLTYCHICDFWCNRLNVLLRVLVFNCFNSALLFLFIFIYLSAWLLKKVWKNFDSTLYAGIIHLSGVFQDLTGRGCSLLMSRSFTYPSKTDLV